MAEENEIHPEEAFLAPLPEERHLWKDLEKADPPVVNILKRVNKILRREFPKTNMVTCSSCSGHIQKGHAKDPSPPMNKEDKPHLWIAAPEETTTAEQRNRMRTMFGSVFLNAVLKANVAIGKDRLGLDEFITDEPGSFSIGGTWYENEYLYRLSVKFSQQENFEAIQAFWSTVEKELTTLDGLSLVTTTSPQDFLEK